MELGSVTCKESALPAVTPTTWSEAVFAFPDGTQEFSVQNTLMELTMKPFKGK